MGRWTYIWVRCDLCRGEAETRSQPRIDRLALERQDTEDALVNPAERLFADESFERLDPERELTRCE
jgi:hypothetical protein